MVAMTLFWIVFGCILKLRRIGLGLLQHHLCILLGSAHFPMQLMDQIAYTPLLESVTRVMLE